MRREGRWSVIVAFALVCAGTQVLWLTYATITTETARHYGVSASAVGWLAEIFPLLYVVLAIPAGILLDRWFRPVLASGGGLVALGGLIRLGGQTFAWAMAGQLVVAVAQPVVLSAVSKLSGEYLPADRRAAGIAVGSAGTFVGILLALLLGPTLGGHGHLQRLLVVEAILATIPALALAFTLRAPGHASSEHAAIAGSAARRLWALAPIRILCGLVFVGFGIFVALATWLQTLLAPAGVSETAAGGLLVGMVIAGILGCAAAAAARRPPRRRARLPARRGARQLPGLRRARRCSLARRARGGDRGDGRCSCCRRCRSSSPPPSGSPAPPPAPPARSSGWPATSAGWWSRCSCRSWCTTRSRPSGDGRGVAARPADARAARLAVERRGAPREPASLIGETRALTGRQRRDRSTCGDAHRRAHRQRLLAVHTCEQRLAAVGAFGTDVQQRIVAVVAALLDAAVRRPPPDSALGAPARRRRASPRSYLELLGAHHHESRSRRRAADDRSAAAAFRAASAPSRPEARIDHVDRAEEATPTARRGLLVELGRRPDWTMPRRAAPPPCPPATGPPPGRG